MTSEAQKKTKILFVIWSLDLGGAEQVVMNLVRHIDRKKFTPVVACLNEKGRYAAKVEKDGIPVVAFHKKPKLDLGLLFRLVSFIKKEKIDLIHTHLFTSNLWGRFAARFSGVPVVITEHNMDTWKKKFHFVIDWFLLQGTARVIFVSEKAREFYRENLGDLKKKSIVLYNGIDTDQFKIQSREAIAAKKAAGIPESAIVVGIVGRLVPQKAHEDFLEMIRILRQSRPEIVGLIVGEGPLRPMLEAKALEKGIAENLVFLGFREDLKDLYHAMNVFVLCSYREGFPMTILEAMASGIPVVATDVGGVRECLTHEETGWLVAPGQPQGLADTVLKALSEHELRERIRKNAEAKVKIFFSIETMVSKHEALYEEVLAQ